MKGNSHEQYKFGRFILDVPNSLLRSSEGVKKLEPLPLQFLCYLIARQGEVVKKEELLKAVWKNRVVSESSIRKVIKGLREALSDNAKNPTYIKTLPLEGYSFVPRVSPFIEPRKTNVLALNIGVKEVASTLLLIITIFFILAFVYPLQTEKLKTTPLTQMPGDVFNADYNPVNNTLFFLYRESIEAPLQIYTKNLSTGITKRLVRDQANYQQPIISPDGTRLAFGKRIDGVLSVYVAQFDENEGLSNIQNLTKGSSINVLSSWSRDGKNLYLTGSTESGRAHALYQLNLESGESKQLTFLNDIGIGVNVAKESPDGKLLAIIRNLAARSFELIIFEKNNWRVIAKQELDFFANSVVWGEDQDEIVITSFLGGFYYYKVKENELIKNDAIELGMNDVFYNCGKACFFMRQLDINFSDIEEIPNPFESTSSASTLQIMDKKGELHPIYNEGGDTIYYVSRGLDSVNLVRQERTQRPEILAELPPNNFVTDLSINYQETHLLGKLESRIFIFDIKDKQLTFLTSKLEVISNPSWNKQGDIVYFSRVENKVPAIYQININNKMSRKVKDNFVQKKQLKDGRTFWVNTKNELFLQTANNEFNYITILPNPYVNHWDVVGDYLFFSSVQNDSFLLSRLNLQTKALDDKVLALNTWRTSFSISSDSNKILTTKLILSRSGLIKVELN